MFQLKEQLLSSQDEGRTCLVEDVAVAGWLSRGPHLQPSLVELLDSVWDVYEGRLDGRETVPGAPVALNRCLHHNRFRRSSVQASVEKICS